MGQQGLRLAAHGVARALRQFTIDGADLLGDMRESFVEQIRAFLHHFLKIFLSLAGVFASIFEVLLRSPKFVLYAL